MKPEIIIIGDKSRKKRPIEFLNVIQWEGNEFKKVHEIYLDRFEKITIIKINNYSFDCLCVCTSKNKENFIYTANFNDGILE